ncbi:geranylgeranylglycerol-phosphate geranylgeranyltransferase [bacterium]|nr:geranylgeranylglycerol-phosphate geranylgeranyltransferase [bacterium]
MMSMLKIVRPINLVLVFFATMVGSALCGKIDLRAVIAGISAASILAGGNAINDFFDIDCDKISHPSRPLPSGKISRKSALILSLVLMLLGILISFALPMKCRIIAIAASLLLILYSAVFSRMPLIGNISIASLSAFAVFYGAFAVGSLSTKSIWAGIIAGTIHLPREIFKDIQDSAGDSASGRKTLPIVWDTKKASYLGVFLCGLAMFVIVLPYLGGLFGEYYISVSFISFVLCGMAAVFGWRGYPKTAQKFLKWALAAGIIALWAESILHS